MRSRPEVKTRWRDAALAGEVWARLRAGEPLDDLELGTIDGRVDLSGFTLPADDRATVATHDISGFVVSELEGESTRALEGIVLDRIDISDGDLAGLLVTDCRIVDCRFDRAVLEGSAFWRSDIEDCTFVGANLDRAQLGAWGLGGPGVPEGGRGNRFERSDFSRARMRWVVCPAGEFIDCCFDEVRLEHVDFGATSFVRCRFGGVLRDVEFRAVSPRSGKPTPNPMETVDFTDAELRDVRFYGLDLAGVYFPAGRQYLQFRDFSGVLQRALNELAYDKDEVASALAAYLRKALEQQGSDQDRGILNLDDLGADAAEVAFARDVLERASSLRH